MMFLCTLIQDKEEETLFRCISKRWNLKHVQFFVLYSKFEILHVMKMLLEQLIFIYFELCVNPTIKHNHQKKSFQPAELDQVRDMLQEMLFASWS